ncbi:IgA peptidase M64-domain-containing protein [Ganoderma leucocontextum]|nr:IgA peptidase M64-domain-containing protein [Ganoderma leucocontextum]
MNCVLLDIWLVLALCLTSAFAADITERPYELIVQREPDTLKCTHLALRETQHFRGLTDSGYFKSKLLESGEERIQFVAEAEQAVWERAESLCGEKHTWDFHTLIPAEPQAHETDQVVLRPLQDNAPPLEVFPLITSGDSSNRVDLVFFADGYTSEEKDKFLDDALRLAEDISSNQTFYTVKPLLNFWAAFVPSKESGVGVGGKPKDTVFGLYRDGTELRGVYYSKPEVAREACDSLGTQCDYPILMGNDPLYGGLGGEFTVITPSLANGPLVLRHELGHSIIDVGEEYDGGFAYFGVNAAHNTTSAGVPWTHWLSPVPHAPAPSHSHPHEDHKHSSPAEKKIRVERSVMPLQNYAWTLLNTSASWSTKFNSSGQYAWHLIRFSLSGIPEASDLVVSLNGADLHWAPRADIGVDRWHYDITLNRTLAEGEHEVTFQLKNKKTEGEAQLCSVEVLEFGDESEFVTAPGHYSLYPTFSEKNETTYRPTNEDCLMRIVTTPNFCRACVEGLWYALLRRVALIDGLAPSCSDSSPSALSNVKSTRVLDLALVPLAHLRDTPVDDGVEVPAFANRTRLVDDGDALGSYVVKVRYWTEEVRVDPEGLLESVAVVTVATRCS